MFKKIKMRQKLSHSISKKTNFLMTLVSTLSVFGTMIVLSGGIWDATSHVINEPEFFWTIQHMVVYSGIGMSTIAGFIAYIVLKTTTLEKFALGVKILVIGTILQIVSGFADSLSHDTFGIDGLLSLSHQPLELGLVLVSLGGFLILKNIPGNSTNKLLPFSIISFIVLTSWLGFNLMLLLGGSIMCIPVYEIFSSGCAIL